MSQKDVTISSDETKIVAGESMAMEPEKSETEATVEETTSKNETEASDSSSKKDEAGGDAKHPSTVISELGEDRKRLASSLIELARESETAAQEVQKIIEEDPAMEKFFKVKFGKEYDALKAGKLTQLKTENIEVDREKIREEERIKVRAELLQSELKNTRQKQLTTYAVSLGFTTDEVAKLEKYADALDDGDFESALKKAALVVNNDKASDSEPPRLFVGGQENNPPKTKEIKITPTLKVFADRQGRDPNELAKSLSQVEDKIDKDGVFHFGGINN